MAKGKRIGLILAVDGEKEFKQQITSINRSITAIKSEMELVTAKYEGNANSLEALRKKYEVQNRLYNEQNVKLNKTKEALKNAEGRYESLGKTVGGMKALFNQQNSELDKLKQSYEDAKQRLKKMTEEGNSSEKAMQKQRGTIAALENAIKAQEAKVDKYNTTLSKAQDEYRKCGNYVKDWQSKVNTADAQVIKAQRSLKQYADYMKEAEESADHCAGSIDEFGKAIDKAIDKTSQLKIGLKEGLLAGFGGSVAEKGLDAAGAVVDAVKDSMVSLSSATADLAAKTGLSEEAMRKYKDVMTEIKGDNFGESYGDVADVMAQIVQIMGELNPSSMKEITESAITLRDTFDMDVNESLRAVDVMVTTMGVDAQKAFDLIAKGAQNGLDRSHELTDNITEYGQLWAQMGFSAEEMFAILENGLDSGAYNLDKVNDYVKEFGVSLADGRIEKNLARFSNGTKSIFQQWKDGKASSRDVFYSVIDDLSKMTNQQEALTVASEVWSALGEDNAMQVITALDDVNTAYSNVQGTMDKLKETKYSDLESAVSQLGATVQEKFLTPIAEKAIPAIVGGVNLVTGAVEGIGNAINPAKSEFETFIGDIEAANNELKTALDNADSAKENALEEGEKIEYLCERLIDLNAIEGKSAAQRLEMDGIVQQLAEHIPQIAEAYDAEAGKVQLADGEIRNLITSTKELMVTQALQAQAQEVINKLVEAQIQYDKANDRFKGLFEAKAAIKELHDEYAKLWDQKNDGLIDDAAFDRMESGLLDRARNLSTALSEALGKDVNIDGAAEPFRYLSEAVLPDVESEMLNVSESMSELEENIADGNASLESLNGVSEEIVDSLGGIKDGAKEAGNVIDDAAGNTEGAAKVIAGAFGMAKNAAEEYGGKAADWIREVGETAKKIAEEDIAKSAEAGAEAQKNALQGVLDKYHGYVDEIEADLQNKVSLFDKFDGGTDMTAEDMQENMQSYVDGVKKYQENLAYVKEQMGDDLSPEFLQYIEDMGLGAANLLEHYAITIRNQGEEGKQIIKDTNDDYMDYLDLTGEIADAQAANKIAMDAYTGELGSTEVEFTDLQNSIEKATQEASGLWGEMSAETEAALNAAVQTARECGVKIPEGLAEGIASGEISPQNALAQMEGALQGAIDGMVQIAEEAGLEIDAGIIAGIESGDPEAVKTAYEKLISYIADNADTAALAEIMDKAGAESTEALGGHAEDAKTEGENVAQAGADGAAGKKPEYKAAGEGNIDEYVAALSTGKGRAAQAAGEVAQAGYTAAGSHDGEFHDVGYNMSAGIAKGITDGDSLVVNAIKGQVRKGLEAGKNEAEIKSPSRKFRREIGQQIGNGVAFGIRDKASLAGKEAANMSAQVYGKATAWLVKYKKSHKVSLDDEKYYWEQIVQHVQEGTAAYNKAIKKVAAAAFSKTGLSGNAATAAMKKIESNFGVSRTKTTGSEKNKKTVNKDAESYYSEIYSAASKYLSNMQTLNDWSLQAELKYWEAVQAQLKKGTQAWYDAQRQINSAKSGLEDEAAQAADALKEANSQIISDAEDYIRKQKILGKMSTSDELAYWRKIIKEVDKGTDAWYDALERINELNEEINEAVAEEAERAAEAVREAVETEKEAARERLRTLQSVHSSILSKYKTYYKVSAKAEMDYWDIARKQFKEGTDERIEADQAYLDAREEYYGQLAELDEDYADRKQDIDDELADSIKELEDAYDDAVNSRKREILSSFNLFEAWDAEGYNKDKLLENLRTQVNGVNFWAEQLEELGQKGVTEELMDELRDMGPDAAANLWSLNQMTGEQLDEYIRLWEEKSRIAQEQARADNEELYKETQDSISKARKKAREELDAAKEEYDRAVADLNAGLTDGLKDLVTKAGDIGEDMVSALVESVRKGVKSVSDEIAKLKGEKEYAEYLQKQAEQEAAERERQRIEQEAEQERQRKEPEAEQERQRKDQEAEPERLRKEQEAIKAKQDAIKAAAEQAERNQILDIIKSGTKRSKNLTAKEKEQHHALWEYLVTRYGFAPDYETYSKLGKALGIKVGEKATAAQKNEILKALKKKGFARGTRAVWEDELAWILENAKTEYLVRKSDQAILQPMRAGDKVINPRGAENVYDFANNPGSFLQPYMRTAFEQKRAEMERQNEALRRQMETLDGSGMARLNRLMEQGNQPSPVVNIDNSGVLPMLKTLASTIDRLVELTEDGKQIVLDTGTLVGEIQKPLSRANAAAQRRRNRGTL